MTPLQIEAGGQSFNFDGSAVVTIGRDPQCDITLVGGTVSRRHAEIRPDETGWTLVDVGSSSGTFHHGTRVSEVRLSGQGTLRIGGVDGDEVGYTVAGARPAPMVDPASLPPAQLQQTVLPGGAVPGSYVQGPALLVRTGGQSRRFVPGTTVRIGRDPANEVVADDASVSRLHAVVESRPDGWWYVDRSTAGTFEGEDGDRVTTRRITEPLTLMLGHPTAGVEIEVVPIVEARQAQRALAGKKRRRTALVVGGIVAALVVVGGGVTAAVVLAGDDDKGGSDGTAADTGLTTAELDRAKQASVFILAADASDTPIYSGSGSIISDTGLILTNAHVGKPSAPGQGEDTDPATLYIALTSPEDDKPVEAAYQAEPIVADGVLDLAVLQITADAQGNPVTPEDLQGTLPPPIPLGDSDDLRTGDEITALGFPGIANLEIDDQLKPALTVTRGVVSTFEGSSQLQSARAWIDSDIRIGHGNSGGASINDDGELIGVNSAIITAEVADENGSGATQGSSLIRPVDLASDIIKIAESGGDPSYVSPYLEAMGDPQQQTEGVSAVANGWADESGKGTCSGTSSVDQPASLPGRTVGETVYAEFTVSGIADGTPVSVDYYALDGKTVIDSTSASWTYGADAVCIDIPFAITEPIDGVNAAFSVGTGGEVIAQNPVLFQ